MDSIKWNEDAEPINADWAQIIYDVRCSDPENLMMDSVADGDLLADEETVALDALVVPYQQLERRMMIMRRLMDRVGTDVKVVEDTNDMKGIVVSDPFKKNGTANIAVTFNLTDGQTISVLFHNPDTTPNRIQPSDSLVSWKWLINKKDVTIVVAPEHGKDLDVHEVARRIMKLANKNSTAFARANAKKAERLKAIADQEAEIKQLEAALPETQKAFEAMQAESQAAEARIATASQSLADAEKRVADLEKERDELKAKKAAAEAEKAKAAENVAPDFPELDTNDDFADFVESQKPEDFEEGTAARKHAMNYLRRTNQLEFKTSIFKDGELEHAEKWQYRDRQWSVSDFGGAEEVSDAATAFRHFAQAVRAGELQVEPSQPEAPKDKVVVVNVDKEIPAANDKSATPPKTETAPEPVTATQDAGDSEWEHDKAILEQIIAKTHPLMAEPDLEPILTAYYQKYKDDTEKNAVVMDAIQSWQDFAVDLAMKTIAAFKN